MNPKPPKIILSDYWRSSSSYRVRIALHLKNLSFQSQNINLLTNAHKQTTYLADNPQGLVPSININGKIITQSLAIIDYLDAFAPNIRLIPEDAENRAFALTFAYAIAMEIQPICNLSVANHISKLISDDPDCQTQQKMNWMQHYIKKGLDNVEQILNNQNKKTKFSCDNLPGITECCLIPQLYNAERWGLDIEQWQNLAHIATECADIDAFRAAHPDNYQPK